MLTRALDQIIFATITLPDHVAEASYAYDQNPEALAAFGQLLDALAAVDQAILGRQARPPREIGDVSDARH